MKVVRSIKEAMMKNMYETKDSVEFIRMCAAKAALDRMRRTTSDSRRSTGSGTKHLE